MRQSQPFSRFIYVTANSTTIPSLHLRHSSLSNHSVASPTSQLILQPLCRFTYVTVPFPTPSVASHMSQLILQSPCHFTYITAHSPILLSLHLHHSSFSNPSFALPTSQLILQHFLCFTYITAHSLTLLLLLLRHGLFTYVTW